MTANTYAAALAELDRLRALNEARTGGEWRIGDDQLIAGVRRADGRCAFCHIGEPSWVGQRDIAGIRMLAHIHPDADPWPHGIYAEREDGHVIVVNDTDKYGYMHDPDAAVIVTAVNLLPGFVALCEGVLERHAPQRAMNGVIYCLGGHALATRWSDCPEARAVLTALGVLDRLGTAEGGSR